MATFNIQPLNRFANSDKTIGPATEFTYFSYDDQHNLHPLSTRSLCYYYPPIFQGPGMSQRPIDLSAGLSTFIKHDDTADDHLDGLLDTLQAYEERRLEQVKEGQLGVKDVRVRADIVTYRGMVTKILTAAYDKFNEFEMNATCYQGTIYIEEDNSAKAQQRVQESERPPRPGQIPQHVMQYWGYKFEALSVLDKPWALSTRAEIESRPSKPVNNHAQYCSIVHTTLAGTSLILAGEVDAVMGEKPDTPSPTVPIPWVELKTSEDFSPANQQSLLKFERKLLRFWAQSKLLDVPTIAVGLRTPQGYLTRIMELKTDDLPGDVRASTRAWDGDVSVQVAGEFLKFLKATVTGEGVWRIRRRKDRNQIEVSNVEAEGTGRIVTESFKAHRERLLTAEVMAALGKRGA